MACAQTGSGNQSVCYESVRCESVRYEPVRFESVWCEVEAVVYPSVVHRTRGECFRCEFSLYEYTCDDSYPL